MLSAPDVLGNKNQPLYLLFFLLVPLEAKGKKLETPPDIEPLSQIIQELNERFGTNFSEQDKVFIQQLEDTNFKFYKRVTDDPEFAKFFLGFLFKRYYDKKRVEQAK